MSNKITIKRSIVGQWVENTYLIAVGNEAFIVDPGDEFEKLDLEFSQYSIRGILCTHAHFDHVGAAANFQSKYNIPFYLHSKDRRLLTQSNLYRKLAGSSDVFGTPRIDFYLDTIDYLMLSNQKIKIHYLPGHTMGSVAFEIEDNVFSGDVIFKSTIGKSDLPGGNPVFLDRSIKLLYTNFKNYNIYPGHGDSFKLEEGFIEEYMRTNEEY